ncbi:hypothetical protein L7F22_057747 [Adiantum nelumboides]|nr:hypothetical protein [Adiantum nelumboides]
MFSEIHTAQKCVELCTPKLPFQKLVREICEAFSQGQKRWKVTALLALQEASEDFIMEYFNVLTVVVAHAHRGTIMGHQAYVSFWRSCGIGRGGNRQDGRAQGHRRGGRYGCAGHGGGGASKLNGRSWGMREEAEVGVPPMAKDVPADNTAEKSVDASAVAEEVPANTMEELRDMREEAEVGVLPVVEDVIADNPTNRMEELKGTREERELGLPPMAEDMAVDNSADDEHHVHPIVQEEPVQSKGEEGVPKKEEPKVQHETRHSTEEPEHVNKQTRHSIEENMELSQEGDKNMTAEDEEDQHSTGKDNGLD